MNPPLKLNAPDEFEAVYERELSYVCHSLRRLGVPAGDRDDLAQEVFVTAFRRFQTYDRKLPLRPWLFGIAFRIASAFRHRARHRETPSPLPDLVDPARSPDELIAAQQSRAMVLRALEVLPLERRAVFVLHDIDGFSIPEVATSLSIPEGTAYTRLRKARRQFTERLRRLRAGGMP